MCPVNAACFSPQSTIEFPDQQNKQQAATNNQQITVREMATVDEQTKLIQQQLQLVLSKLPNQHAVIDPAKYQHILHPTTTTQQQQQPSSSSSSSSLPVESYIDHTVLKPNVTQREIEQLCQEAIDYHFYAVCVNWCRLETCVQLLRSSSVKTAVVIGFPLGATSTKTKVHETSEALELGANEIDMVINIGKLLDGDYEFVFSEVRQLAQLCDAHQAKLKCILETSQLPSDTVLIDACLLCLLAGAHFVKTCTGFMGGGATLEHVLLMRRVVGFDTGVQVKASGGVRSYEDARRIITEGCVDRIGTSSGIAIINGAMQQGVSSSSSSQQQQAATTDAY